MTETLTIIGFAIFGAFCAAAYWATDGFIDFAVNDLPRRRSETAKSQAELDWKSGLAMLGGPFGTYESRADARGWAWDAADRYAKNYREYVYLRDRAIKAGRVNPQHESHLYSLALQSAK